MQNRKVTYALYPSPNQVAKLMALQHAHQQLWNAALEERIDAWRKKKVSISYEDQSSSLTLIRKDAEIGAEWSAINCSSQQVTLRRLNTAFAAFYGRVKKGETPGFPRFKSQRRLSSLGFKSHTDGWKFTPRLQNKGKADAQGNVHWSKHGVLFITGVGHMQARGQARCAGVIKSCEVLCQNEKWSVSITLECEDAGLQRKRTHNQIMAADWGMHDLLTIAQPSHQLTARPSMPSPAIRFSTIENPRWYKTSQAKSIALAQSVSRKKKFSKRWHKAQHARAVFEAKRARKRHDHQHKLSAAIAAQCEIFATEALNIQSMTSNNDATCKKKKNDFHRELLDTAPGALFKKIAYKVSETGGQYLTAPTKKLKPSQTCPQCRHQHKKPLDERIHDCQECKLHLGRDEAAALVVLYWLLGILPPIKKVTRAGTGRKPTPSQDDVVLSALKPRNLVPS